MVDTRKILDGILNPANSPEGNKDGAATRRSPLDDLNLGGVGGGAAAGGLVALLLGTKTGRKMGKSALKLGGFALIAALAYRAWQNWTSKAGQTGAPARDDAPKSLPVPADTAFLPSRADEQQRIARNILRAMIAAAKADGHIDAREMDRIHAKMDDLDLGVSEKAFVMDELRAAPDLAAIARDSRTGEEAAELYAASVLAIDGTKPEERRHLDRLAGLLGLDDALVSEIEDSVRDVVVLKR